MRPALSRLRDAFGPCHLVDASVLILLLVISSAVYLVYRDLGLDDAFITYRMAENAAKGLGLVYNQGERVLVSTTPLFIVFLAAAGTIYPDIPSLGAITSCIGLFASSAFMYLWIRRDLGFVVALVSSALYAGFPLLLSTVGMETPIYLMFAMGALYFYFANRLTACSVFLALLTLTRPDGIVLAVVIFVHFLTTQRRLPIRQMVGYVAIIVPWFLFSQLYYGSPFPNTLGAKMAHGQSFWWSRHFLEGALALAIQYYQQDRLFLLLAVFGVFGLIALLRESAKHGIIFIWVALYSAGYVFLRVPDFHWYYAPLVPAIILAAAMGIVRLPYDLLSRLRLGPRQGPKIVSSSIAILLFALFALVIFRVDARLAEVIPEPRFDIYKQVGLWLEQDTPHSSSVAAVEIGIIGYFSNRKIIDIIGLTHADTAKEIAANDFTYAVRHYQPDYIILTTSSLLDMQTAPWFGGQYIPVKYLQDERFSPDPMIIYSKVDGKGLTELVRKEVTFDNQIKLSGYSIQPKTLLPGENLRLDLAFEPLRTTQDDIGAFASLVDGSGHVLVQKDIVVRSAGWAPGTTVQHLDIRVPSLAKPGKYEVHVGLYYLPSFKMLATAEENSETNGDRLRLGPVKVASTQVAIQPAISVAATLAGKISLIGYTISVPEKTKPRQFDIQLFWRATTQITDDFTVFVHLLNSQGQLVGQHDGQPLGGSYPTSIWDTGETIVDAHTIQGIDSLPDGEYQIAVGMYGGPTGKRLPVEAGNITVVDDAILLGKVRLPQ